MNIEHRTRERPTSNNEFCQFKKKTEQHAALALHERIYDSKFDSAESFDSEGTTEVLVAGCGSLVL